MRLRRPKCFAVLLAAYLGTFSSASAANGAVPTGATPGSPTMAKSSSSARHHDGFYARLAVGLQYSAFWGAYFGDPVSLNGLGPGFAVSFGATPIEGVVIGGTLSFTAGEGTLHGRPPGPQTPFILAPLLGPFVDWYPSASGPWHVGSAFGLGGFSGSDANNKSFVGYAPALAAFAGFELWLSPEWSAGFMLVAQGTAPATQRGGSGYRLEAASIGLQYTVLYH